MSKDEKVFLYDETHKNVGRAESTFFSCLDEYFQRHNALIKLKKKEGVVFEKDSMVSYLAEIFRSPAYVFEAILRCGPHRFSSSVTFPDGEKLEIAVDDEIADMLVKDPAFIKFTQDVDFNNRTQALDDLEYETLKKCLFNYTGGGELSGYYSESGLAVLEKIKEDVRKCTVVGKKLARSAQDKKNFFNGWAHGKIEFDYRNDPFRPDGALVTAGTPAEELIKLENEHYEYAKASITAFADFMQGFSAITIGSLCHVSKSSELYHNPDYEPYWCTNEEIGTPSKELGQYVASAFERKAMACENAIHAERLKELQEKVIKENKRNADRQEAIKAQQEAEARHKVIEQQQRERQAELKQQAFEEFIHNPQPYELANASNIPVLRHMDHVSGAKASLGKKYCQLVESSLGILDRRYVDGEKMVSGPDEIKPVDELAKALLCGKGLVNLAYAFDLSHVVNGDGEQVRAVDGAQTLRTMYDSPSKALIDQLLDDPRGVLLVGSHLLRKEQCRSYASHLLVAQDKLDKAAAQFNTIYAKLDQTAKAMGVRLSQLQIDHPDDRDVKAYNKAAQELQDAQGNKYANVKPFAAAVRQCLAGRSNKRVVYTPAGQLAAEATAFDVPPSWKGVLASNEFSSVSDPQKPHERSPRFYCDESEKEGYVHVVSAAHPVEIAIDVKRSASNDVLKESLRELVKQEKQQEAKEQAQAYLYKVGFGLDNGVLRHPEYEIELPLAKASQDDYWQANLAFEAKQEEQQQLLQAAVKAGVQVRDAKGGLLSVGEDGSLSSIEKWPLSVKWQNEKTSKIASRGYLSSDDMKLLGYMLEKARPIAQTRMPAIDDSAPAQDVSKTLDHAPARKLLLPDSNIFESLVCMNRRTGDDVKPRTYLDMLKATSRLPGMLLVVPSAIADAELRGVVPEYDAKGKFSGLHVFDKKRNHKEAFDQFFQGASRGRIVNGKVQIYQEGNGTSNVLILETPEGPAQQKFYTAIADAEKHAATAGADAWPALQANVYKRGMGEACINELIAQYPHKEEITVLSDDMHYLRGRTKIVGGQVLEDHVVPINSGAGAAVNCSTLLPYLQVEAKHRRGQALHKADKDTLPEYPYIRDVYLRDCADEKGRPPMQIAYAHRGMAKDFSKGHYISDVIGEAFHEAGRLEAIRKSTPTPASEPVGTEVEEGEAQRQTTQKAAGEELPRPGNGGAGAKERAHGKRGGVDSIGF